MKKLIRSAAFGAVSFAAVLAGASAVASPGAGDIKTGADLVAACNASLDRDATQGGQISATACNQYLAGMVTAVYNATEAGMPTTLHRLGKDGKESVCFHLPNLLKYSEFAALVVAYSKAHPELGAQPAVELAGRSLADKYPCKE